MFDNGRLKTANFNTDQGFGLRAVAGEASGYAHAGDLSVSRCARPMPFPPSRAVIPARYAAAPARTNRHLYGDENPIGSPSFEAKVKAAAGNRRLSARQGSARAAGFGFARRLLAGGRDLRADGHRGPRHPPDGPHQRLRRGRRWRPAGKRLLRHGRPQGFGEFLAEDSWQHAAEEALRQRWSISRR
jgi:TldD protein